MTVESREPDNHLPNSDESIHSRGLRDLTPQELAEAIVTNSKRGDGDEPWSLVEVELEDPDSLEGEITR